MWSSWRSNARGHRRRIATPSKRVNDNSKRVRQAKQQVIDNAAMGIAVVLDVVVILSKRPDVVFLPVP